MKKIKIEWCENWIKARFTKHHPYPGVGGIEAHLFWDMAEKAGLWVRGTYNTPMTKALEKLCTVEIASDNDGNFLYHYFRLKQNSLTPEVLV